MNSLFSSKTLGKIRRLPPLAVGGALFAVAALWMGLFFSGQLRQLGQKRERLADLVFQCRKQLSLRESLAQFEALYGGADSYYLDKVLETKSFLSEEREALVAIVNEPAFQNWEGIQERVNFLESAKNRLQFSESSRRVGGGFSEVEFKLLHPIQADREDLRTLLTSIEGRVPHRPCLLLKKFELKRGKAFSSNEVYMLDFELIKKDLIKNEKK